MSVRAHINKFEGLLEAREEVTSKTAAHTNTLSTCEHEQTSALRCKHTNTHLQTQTHQVPSIHQPSDSTLLSSAQRPTLASIQAEGSVLLAGAATS